MADEPGSPAMLDVAAEHTTARVPVAHPDEHVGEVRDRLFGQDYDTVEDIAVLAGGRLVGLVPIERLLRAGAGERIDAVMDADPPSVGPGVDQERVARKLVDRAEASLAVVDRDGRFIGLIPPHRMLHVLLAEHEEDLARLGGYLAGTRRARTAAQEPLGRRLWHRLPWLLLGLVGAMASAVLVGAFEDELAANVLVAFFLPGVIYMADAVGTQTETVVIRGLSAGVTLAPLVGRELLTGFVIGIVVGAAFFPFALVAWDDGSIALAVALALVVSCSVATVVAMALPWTFQRLGLDPAFGSGPLATVIQDLLSIVAYLAIATRLVD